MRIVHYQQQLRGLDSGTANAGRGWCEALARLGVEVIGLIDAGDIHRPPPAGTETIPLAHSLVGPFRVPRGLSAHVRRADAVVVHGGWQLGNVVVGRLSARMNVPFVVTTHGVYLSETFRRRTRIKRVWAKVLERPHLKNATGVHVFFPEERDSMESALGIRVSTIVAPNGVAVPASVAWDGGSGGYLLWLGRFDPTTKGLDLLVRAIGQIRPGRRPHVRLHGPDWRDHKRKLHALVRELALERWISIGEPVYGDDKWRLLREASGYVYPSRWDACPVALAEAAMVGVPTVATRYPLANFLAARGAVLQVDPAASSIADGVVQVMNPKAARVGKRAAQVARTELTWDVVARSWLDQLKDLVRSSAGGQHRG